MPIVIQKDIPAYKIMQSENVFVMPYVRAVAQDIRPIEIAIVNLMPTKIVTETQLIRLLSNSPLQINLTLITTSSYTSKNTSSEHLEKFYKSFDEIKDKPFDGLIITGAPVETLEFEDVEYWSELKKIMEFSKTKVTSTIHICWGAQAGLKYHYNIDKHEFDKKLFGVFENHSEVNFDPLLKGLDDKFYVPNSRHTYVNETDIRNCNKLRVLASSKDTGPSIIKSVDNKNFFMFGHSEYDKETLKAEYFRDLEKGLAIEKPQNYFCDDKFTINNNWSSTANIIFSNWLNYYVYQVTPFSI